MALFGLGRKPATFGLDIGASSIKVVELVRRQGRVRAEVSRHRVACPRCIIEGSIRKPEVVTDAIKECVRKARIATSAAVVSVSGRDSIVKRVPLPKVSVKELADAILLEAEHHIPFAIDEVFLDYQVVGETATSMSVVLVATKKVKVLEYVAAVEEAGLDAAVVDLDAFAIQNQFELNQPGDGNEGGGAHRHRRRRHEDQCGPRGASIFARDVPFGGNNYTDAIAARLGVPFEKAEGRQAGTGGGRRLGRSGAGARGGLARSVAGGAATFGLLRVDGRVRAHRQDVLSGGCASWPASRISSPLLGRAGGAGPSL